MTKLLLLGSPLRNVTAVASEWVRSFWAVQRLLRLMFGGPWYEMSYVGLVLFVQYKTCFMHGPKIEHRCLFSEFLLVKTNLGKVSKIKKK